MQLHPALFTTLIAERERSLRQRAAAQRARPRRERRARRAPWIP
jgi:hypothetical protein